MTALFYSDSSHLKMNDNIPLLNEGIVQVASVHACIAGGADRAGWRIQALDLCGHILVGGRGHIYTITVGIFEDKRKEHTISTPKYEFDKNQEK